MQQGQAWYNSSEVILGAIKEMAAKVNWTGVPERAAIFSRQSLALSISENNCSGTYQTGLGRDPDGNNVPINSSIQKIGPFLDNLESFILFPPSLACNASCMRTMVVPGSNHPRAFQTVTGRQSRSSCSVILHSSLQTSVSRSAVNQLSTTASTGRWTQKREWVRVRPLRAPLHRSSSVGLTSSPRGCYRELQ
jgi:hypothetical protein